jgi:hypothetical protein
VSKDSKKCLLSDVFGKRRITKNSDCQAEESSLVSANKDKSRVIIADRKP